LWWEGIAERIKKLTPSQFKYILSGMKNLPKFGGRARNYREFEVRI
jgi:hypothetical protein